MYLNTNFLAEIFKGIFKKSVYGNTSIKIGDFKLTGDSLDLLNPDSNVDYFQQLASEITKFVFLSKDQVIELNFDGTTERITREDLLKAFGILANTVSDALYFVGEHESQDCTASQDVKSILEDLTGMGLSSILEMGSAKEKYGGLVKDKLKPLIRKIKVDKDKATLDYFDSLMVSIHQSFSKKYGIGGILLITKVLYLVAAGLSILKLNDYLRNLSK